MTYDYYLHEGMNLAKILVSLMLSLFSTSMSTTNLDTHYKTRH
jgi:hypothetical protein